MCICIIRDPRTESADTPDLSDWLKRVTCSMRTFVQNKFESYSAMLHAPMATNVDEK